MSASVGVRAQFEALTVKSGKTAVQLAVDPEDRWALPELSQLVGRMVAVDLREDREVVVVDGPTGEVLGGAGAARTGSCGAVAGELPAADEVEEAVHEEWCE